MTEIVGTITQEIIGTLESKTITVGVISGGLTINGDGASTIGDIPGLQDALDARLLTSSRGSANGVASLVAGLIPSEQLPSYVDDVLEFANLEALPTTGEAGKIYVAIDTSKTYRWSGSTYIRTGGLLNVDDTSDLNKPLSTASIAALATKQNVVGRAAIFERTDFLNTTVTSQGAFVAFNLFGGTIGTAASADYTPNHHGIWLVRSAATLNSGYGALTNADSTMLSGEMTFDLCFKTPSTLANTQYTFGHINVGNHTSPSTNGAWISSVAGVLTGNTASASATSATPTIITLSTDTWYHTRITVVSLSSILFEMYSDAGALLGSASLTTNIPTSNTTRMRTGFMATGNSGAAADVIKMDYMEFKAPGLQRGAL